MPVEIERKFLVEGDGWRQGQGIRMRQGYLCADADKNVRVRIAGDKAFLTVKGAKRGTTRAEYEYEIPVSHAEELMAFCMKDFYIEKIRHKVVQGALVWDIDEFLGQNKGLIIAEVELEREDQPFERPAWLGREVTLEARYYNLNLCRKPFVLWKT